MIRTILLGFILISFLNCKPQKEKEVNDKINTPKVKELKSDTLKKITNKASKNDRTKTQKNNVVLATLIPIEILNAKEKDVYKKYGLAFSGNCYNCDLAKFRIENHSIFITNVCAPETELSFDIVKLSTNRNMIEINTKNYSFQFLRIANDPVYELKIINADFKNKDLLISKYFTLKKDLVKFEVHDCGDFDG